MIQCHRVFLNVFSVLSVFWKHIPPLQATHTPYIHVHIQIRLLYKRFATYGFFSVFQHLVWMSHRFSFISFCPGVCVNILCTWLEQQKKRHLESNIFTRTLESFSLVHCNKWRRKIVLCAMESVHLARSSINPKLQVIHFQFYSVVEHSFFFCCSSFFYVFRFASHISSVAKLLYCHFLAISHLFCSSLRHFVHFALLNTIPITLGMFN